MAVALCILSVNTCDKSHYWLYSNKPTVAYDTKTKSVFLFSLVFYQDIVCSLTTKLKLILDKTQCAQIKLTKRERKVILALLEDNSEAKNDLLLSYTEPRF